MQQRLLTYVPTHLTAYGVVHAALSITESMNSEQLRCFFYVPSGDSEIKAGIVKKTIPSFISQILYKAKLLYLHKVISEILFFRKIKGGDIIYLWPGVSLSLIKKVKAKGNVIIIENINCHQVTSTNFRWGGKAAKHYQHLPNDTAV